MFNIVQDDADPNVLHLFEVYQGDKAMEAHEKPDLERVLLAFRGTGNRRTWE